MQRAYGYVYDPLNRLLQGDFVARTTGTATSANDWRGEADNYRLAFASYDDNGNLKTLRRRGLLANATHTGPKQFGPVDALTYAYAGNRLQAVDDQVSTNQLPRPTGYEGAPSSLASDFQEGRMHQTTEYDSSPIAVPISVGGALLAAHGLATWTKASYNITHQTYQKTNQQTGEVYSGKTSGKGTPRQNVANRDKKPDHQQKNKEGYGPAKLEQSSTNKSAIRGREQQLIEKTAGPKNRAIHRETK